MYCIKLLALFLFFTLNLLSCTAQGTCIQKEVIVKTHDTLTKIANNNGCSKRERISFINDYKKQKGHTDIKPGQKIPIACGCKGSENLIHLRVQAVSFTITSQDVETFYRGHPNEKINELKKLRVPGGQLADVIGVTIRGMESLIPFEYLANGYTYYFHENPDSYRYPESVRVCNSKSGKCGLDIYKHTVDSMEYFPQLPARVVPHTQAQARQQAQAQARQQAQVQARQQAQIRQQAQARQQSQAVLSPPAVDECRVSQGQVVSAQNRPILNARVSLLIPNVSAFEHTSIRDSSNVMAEVYSQKNGLFNLNKNLDRDFKYSILVEADGRYAEKEIDLVKGCPQGSIKIIFR